MPVQGDNVGKKENMGLPTLDCLGSNRLEKGGWIAIRIIVEALVES